MASENWNGYGKAAESRREYQEKKRGEEAILERTPGRRMERITKVLNNFLMMTAQQAAHQDFIISCDGSLNKELDKMKSAVEVRMESQLHYLFEIDLDAKSQALKIKNIITISCI